MFWRPLTLLLVCFSFGVYESKSVVLPPAKVNSKIGNIKSNPVQKVQLPDGVKLLIGAGGIYGAFLYYGTLQEDVFHYKAADGSKFSSAWFLQSVGELKIFH
jgi:hypothetical protein